MNKDSKIKIILVGGLVIFALLFSYLDDDNYTDSFLGNQAAQQLDFDNTNGNFDQIYLYSTDLVEGFGISKRINAEENYALSIRANLPKLSENEKYVGWLAKDDKSSSTTFLLLGALSYEENEFFLIYQSKNNLEEFKNVIITRVESSDDLSIPKNKVLFGSF